MGSGGLVGSAGGGFGGDQKLSLAPLLHQAALYPHSAVVTADKSDTWSGLPDGGWRDLAG